MFGQGAGEGGDPRGRADELVGPRGEREVHTLPRGLNTHAVYSSQL